MFSVAAIKVITDYVVAGNTLGKGTFCTRSCRRRVIKRGVRRAIVQEAVVNAVNGQGRWLGSARVPAGTHEIPVARTLLPQLDLHGKLALSDAAHTQTQTATTVLFEGGGDYLRTVKENQKELCQTLTKLLEPQRFSP